MNSITESRSGSTIANNGRKALTKQEKLVLTGFQDAVQIARGPVAPGDVYLVLVFNSNQMLNLQGPRDVQDYADRLQQMGYLREVGHDRYIPKDDVFKDQTAQQSQT